MTEIRSYTFLKPANVGLSNGMYVNVAQHQSIAISEVEGWKERAVRHMVESGIMVPSSAAPTDLKELAVAGTGVNERDGVDDVPIAFDPHGRPVVSEPEDDPEPAAETAESFAAVEGRTYPHHLGGSKYQLSDGSVVSGRAKAARDQAALDG